MRLGKILSHEQFIPQVPSLRFLADSSKVSKSRPSQSRARSLDRLICNSFFYVSNKPNFGEKKELKKMLGGRGTHGLTRAKQRFAWKRHLAEQKMNKDFRI